MKLTELLTLDVYWLAGYRTRITADNRFATPDISFSVFGVDKTGHYTIDLYNGLSEHDAVKAFLENENLDY